MREALKQALLADGFGDGKDPHCLLIPNDVWEECWRWSNNNGCYGRPVPMGYEIEKTMKGQGHALVPEDFENNDIHNSKVFYIPDTVKYLFTKMRWG